MKHRSALRLAAVNAAWLFIVGLFAILPNAHAGQVHYREVTLEELGRHAEVLLEVEVGPEGQFPVKLPVFSPGDPEYGGNDCQTYDYGAWRVTLQADPLERATSGLKRGHSILIFPSHTADLLELTRHHCRTGGSVSPLFQRFDGHPPKAGARRLLWARWSPGLGWVEAVAGSWLKLSKKSEAVKAFGAIAPRRSAGAEAKAPDSALCVEHSDCTMASPTCDICGSCPGHETHAWTHAALWRFAARCARPAPEPPSKDGPQLPSPPPPNCAPCAAPTDGPRPVAQCVQMRCAAVKP